MSDDKLHLELETDNPAEFLRSEDGVFEVTSPYGQVFWVTCRRGSRMHVRQISEPKIPWNRQQIPWKIRRQIHRDQICHIFERTRRERILGYFIIFIVFAGVLYVLHRTGFPLPLPPLR